MSERIRVRWVNPNLEGEEPTFALQCQTTNQIWRIESILSVNDAPTTDTAINSAIYTSHFGWGEVVDDGIHFWSE